jgi:hypothetical protein
MKRNLMEIPSKNGRRLNTVDAGSEVRVIPMPLPTERKIRYRVDRPMLCLAFRDNHHAAVTIQAGKVFEVVGPAEDDRFVVVDIGGEQFLVFVSDLTDYGKLVPDTMVSRSPRGRAS